MNDRFKFRYFYKPSGKYINPPNLVYNNGSYDQLSIRQNTNGIFESYIITSWNTSDVIPEQCTGLKDKNGKLIYEGDIILVDDDKCPIEWDSDNARYNVVGYGEIAYLNYNDIEVIGNIYQNPELLEEYNAD